jgi:hypothetical protein
MQNARTRMQCIPLQSGDNRSHITPMDAAYESSSWPSQRHALSVGVNTEMHQCSTQRVLGNKQASLRHAKSVAKHCVALVHFVLPACVVSFFISRHVTLCSSAVLP